MILFLKNPLFTVVVAGTGGVKIPYWLAVSRSGATPPWGPQQYGALVFWSLGAATYARCVWDFAVTGRGTPAPLDAPKVLVVRGLYQNVRNPIYLGALLVVLGWALYWSSLAVLDYAAALALGFHLFVVLVEEPTLRRQFGESYERYCRAVNRWMPGKRRVPWT